MLISKLLDEVGAERLSNYAGTLAMINLGRPDSCSSQFVINCDHNRWADAWELESPASHFVFGKLVRRGDLDVAKKAARGATADDDRPADPLKVVRIRMGTAEDAAAKAKAEKEADLPPLRLEDAVAVAGAMKTRTGRGTDNLGPSDLRNAPAESIKELLELFEACELAIAWPWHSPGR